MAKEIIKENHSLADTDLNSVYPLLAPCKSCLEKKKEKPVHEPLLSRLSEGAQSKLKPVLQNQKKKKKAVQGSESDHFAEYGFGMVAYRNLQWTFVCLFAVLSLVMTPAIIFYSEYDGISNGKYFSGQSLGNMGYSTYSCSLSPLGAGNDNDTVVVPIQCSFGNYNNTYSYGVNPSNLMPNDLCVRDDTLNSECSNNLNATYINAEIES